MLPAETYNFYFNNAILLITIASFIVYAQGLPKINLIVGYNRLNDWLVCGVITLFIGTRPISGAFVDMTTYAMAYEMMTYGGQTSFYDWLFDFFMSSMAGNFSTETFFLACTILYIVPLAIASRRIHMNWGFASFLAFVGAFSFFTYGVNGIRNGIATSLVILAFAYYDRKVVMGMIMLAAVGFHKSAALPVAAFLVSMAMPRVGIYASLWFICMVFSLTFGETISPVISNILPIGEDERLASYAQGMGEDKGGFRWDFILYSIVPVIVAYSLADHRVRQEVFYRRLVSTYLIANAFWLLMMYAAYSNRFAYLSWFMLPWVIIYPLIPTSRTTGIDSMQMRPSSRLALLGIALVAHQSFTYVMSVFIYPQIRGG